MGCIKRNQEFPAHAEPLSRSDAHPFFRSGYNLGILLDEIGDRDVVVDACLSPQLVEDLRRNHVNAVWVPAILGDGASDDEIDRQLLRGFGEKKERVLLTRDVEFYKRIRNRAILVSFKSMTLKTRDLEELDLRKEIKFLRLSSMSAPLRR